MQLPAMPWETPASVSYLLFGQQAQPGAAGRILVALLVVVVAAAVLVAVGIVARRMLLGGEDPLQAAENFTIADLRRLRDEGQLTEQEYERARAQLIAQGRSLLKEDAEDGAEQS